MLIAPEGEVLEMVILLGFPATNNEAEYEVLFQGVHNVLRLRAKELVIYSDSQLVVNQLTGLYNARMATMATYMEKTKQLLHRLHDYQVIQIPKEQNDHADALATLASADQLGVKRVIQVQVLERPSIDELQEKIRCVEEQKPSWMDPIVAYLKDGILLEDKKEARKLTIKAARFWLSPDQKLYKRSFSGPYLLCVHPGRVEDLLFEIHEGSCGAHAAGKALAFRAITQGFWWPYMQKDALQYIKKCEKCQKFALIPHQSAGDLCPLTSPWHFDQWGLDIVGPLPRATGNRRFLITATDYFTKWIEAKPLAAIRDIDTRKFVWENIITRFGIPHALISDNGTQFSSAKFKEFCGGYGIKNIYSTPAYPQCNGQAEVSNKIILDGIKKRLESFNGRWVEELPSVLWAYRTTLRKSTGESPFVLAYGAEVVIPIEIGLPTLRTQMFKEGNNDLTKDPTDGKLGPNWEGPFQVIARSKNQSSGFHYEAVGKEVRSYLRLEKRPKVTCGWKGGLKLLQNCRSTVSAVTPHASTVIHHSSTVLSLPPINGHEKVNNPPTQVIEIEDDEDDEELKVLEAFLTWNTEDQVEDIKEQLQYLKREF
ncbi:uncharacterized protein LOC120008706 [Tripterygium wilfordii]|uniref:uncharacterized protein LOC120008706 n=1 Tax=Tripterygium wilfordii TaxID=458696 RepID=UPI0018F7F92D|nr:uncharacterized protein LOC120008706 [Tripterygium wilfordii]